ncbi:VOC family protein [Photobacterium rosenbergii]|uniref:VOC family protein n=1 Tax=Photobacterium rosenbergii TaxID=294936 RepID=UPI001C9A1EFD|nr:VOC family protein [Photobacterium rosenbergii]MBY5945002.1 VOC family protein [Photobacterium rosenbergii]
MKIEHVAMWVRDLEAMRTFYQTYFNAVSNEKYVNAKKGFSSYFLSFDKGARLEIMHNDAIPMSADDPMAQFTGLIHLAMSVGSEQEVDALTARLAKDGYNVVDDPRRTGDGYYESVVLDPEGNRLEITM